MSDMMRAVICEGAGEAEVMRLAQVARPNAGQGQLLVRVHAAGVNRPDVLQRKGLYAPPADASPLLGLEVAGEIVAGDVGEHWRIGDAVCALSHGGGYADYVVVEREQCLPVPQGWTMAQAASLPETYFTVWLNVFQKAHLGHEKHETLLVHAGASGIGVAAIQMAKAMGQAVWVSAGTDEKRKACLKLGAAGVLDYHDEQWVDVFKKAVPNGADVILDMVGGSSLKQNLEAIAQSGRLAWIAFLQSNSVELKISDIMTKEICLTGSFLRRQSLDVKAKIARELSESIWPKINLGQIVPVIDSVYGFENVVSAHKRMESNAHIGKIVLQW